MFAAELCHEVKRPSSLSFGTVAAERFSFQVAEQFYTDSEEKVWEGCGKMSEGLEGPKPHDRTDFCLTQITTMHNALRATRITSAQS